MTEAHRNGVNDPMTASLIRVPGNGDLMRPEACQQAISVFDGRMRYDLKLVYKRMDKVRPTRATTGPSWFARCSSRRSPATCRRARRSNI